MDTTMKAQKAYKTMLAALDSRKDLTEAEREQLKKAIQQNMDNLNV